MQCKAAGPSQDSRFQSPQSADQAPVGATDSQAQDVSVLAQRFLFASPVLVDAEAYGVTVTRRQGAGVAELDPPEEARLLDLLSHASARLHECQEGEVEFPMWVVSSDCRDAKPRPVWLVLGQLEGGGYRISLSDV